MSDDHDLQRTAEWHQQRAGKWTGSRFVDVLARSSKGEPLKAYHDLIWVVVTERICNAPIEGPTGYALQWGTDVEPFALESYELESGNIVTKSGFIAHPEFDFVGCSPDGLIGEDGGLEMKCPKSQIVHAERFLSGVPTIYKPQIQGCMWITGRSWWDFYSFDPRFPLGLRGLKIRVNRDQDFIDKLQIEVLKAEMKAQELFERLQRRAA